MNVLPSHALLDRDVVVRTLDNLGAQRSAALRVLYVADDPNARAVDLAQVVSGDPVLAAQVMRLANSAYYGLSGRVGSVEFAVSMLGFALVRCIAATHAVSGLGPGRGPGADFWSESALVAAATAEAGSAIGMPRPEAFSLGLLHDLGRAALNGIDAHAYRAICDAPGAAAESLRVELERRAFGMDHAEVGSIVLQAWRFPDAMAEAVAAHHHPLSADASPTRRALVAGLAIAELAEWPDLDSFRSGGGLPALEQELSLAGFSLDVGFDLSRSVRLQSAAISTAFTALAA